LSPKKGAYFAVASANKIPRRDLAEDAHHTSANFRNTMSSRSPPPTYFNAVRGLGMHFSTFQIARLPVPPPPF